MTNHLRKAKEAIDKSPLKKIWERIGIKHHRGFSLPLFSLHSKNSCGIGEYLDLLPMIDFAKETGFNIIQLLPINDSGEDPSPYNSLSSIALHPIYISLHKLPLVESCPNLLKQIEHLQKLCQTDHVEYVNVLSLKRTFFKDYYDLFGEKFLQDPEYQNFLRENTWLKKYALYKTLKESMSVLNWREWPKELSSPTKELVENLYKLHKKEISFHSLMQFFCYKQMKSVKEYAELKGVYIKGDIPILISPDSADVYLDRHLFSLDFLVGHPPDVFNEDGQFWGFPSYLWEEMENTNFEWWKTRLSFAENFYHMYRLDHVAGFYRLWHIPYGKKPTEGFWNPKKLEDVVKLGHANLTRIIGFSSMLPIAEDLGIIPKKVFDSLKSLGLAGTRVLRWMRERGIAGKFYPYEDYFPVNMTCVSTHDSETLGHWWNELEKEAKAFAKFRGWEYKTPLSVEQRSLILKEALRVPTLLHINLLQEYLALVPSLVHSDPKEERINQPGFILPTNWTYRFKASVEKIISSEILKIRLSEIL